MGFSSYSANVGKVRNSGFEASLSAYIIRDMERDFSWMVSGQLIYNKNEVIKLSDAIKAQNDEYVSTGDLSNTSPANLLYEGRPQYGIYVVRSLGIDPATGKEIYLDKNGNPTTVWNTADRVYALFESDPLFGRNLFKAKTGMTISAFVLEYRMLAFCELLACTNMTVREISAYLGCSNEQVTRDFKKWMGCSPIAYRTRNRPKHYDLLFKM